MEEEKGTTRVGIEGNQLLRPFELAKALGIGRTSLYRLLAQQDFPAPCRLTPRIRAWRWGDIESWLERRREPARG